MRKYIFGIGILISVSAFSQKGYHGLFIGTNVSGINLDLGSSQVSGLPNKNFANPKVGISMGYKYSILISPKFSLGVGLEFKKINTEFNRPHYNDPNDINPNLSSINENLGFSRISIPMQGYYKAINRDNHSFYFTTGIECAVVNNIKRTANYKIQSPLQVMLMRHLKEIKQLNLMTIVSLAFLY